MFQNLSNQEDSGLQQCPLSLSPVALSPRLSSEGEQPCPNSTSSDSSCWFVPEGHEMKVRSCAPIPEEGIAKSHVGPELGPDRSLAP